MRYDGLILRKQSAGSCQVGVMRRGRYVKGKRVGKGNLVNEVSPSTAIALILHLVRRL